MVEKVMTVIEVTFYTRTSCIFFAFFAAFSYRIPQNPELLMCFLSLQGTYNIPGSTSTVTAIGCCVCYADRNLYCNMQLKG